MSLSLLFTICNTALITEKLLHFRFKSNLQEVLLLPAFLIWMVGEGVRLYFAYVGNLKVRFLDGEEGRYDEEWMTKARSLSELRRKKR